MFYQSLLFLLPRLLRLLVFLFGVAARFVDLRLELVEPLFVGLQRSFRFLAVLFMFFGRVGFQGLVGFCREITTIAIGNVPRIISPFTCKIQATLKAGSCRARRDW